MEIKVKILRSVWVVFEGGNGDLYQENAVTFHCCFDTLNDAKLWADNHLTGFYGDLTPWWQEPSDWTSELWSRTLVYQGEGKTCYVAKQNIYICEAVQSE